MKKTVQLLFLSLFMCMPFSSDAQIFKKLKRSIERAAEKTLEKKVEEKTEKEVGDVFDDTFNNDGKILNNAKVSPASSYSFTHKYVTKIDDGKNDPININYYLTKKAEFIGMKMDLKGAQDMFTVIDIPNETVHLFMSMSGKKSTMSVGVNFDKAVAEGTEYPDMKITKTGNTKKILSYNCDEYDVKGKDLSGKVWITQNAPVSFGKNFYNMSSNKLKKANQMAQSWLANMDGLVMEMRMTDTSKRNATVMTMTCIALDKTNFTLNSNDYR